MNNFQWSGSFFTPTVGKRYKVPEDSANYNELRGEEGECINFNQSGLGHVWATMRFDKLGVKKVRTSYLVPVEDVKVALIEGFDDADMTPAEKQRYALEHGGNAGTVFLRGV